MTPTGWRSRTRLPAGWRPDFILLDLAGEPDSGSGRGRAPVPVIGLAAGGEASATARRRGSGGDATGSWRGPPSIASGRAIQSADWDDLRSLIDREWPADRRSGRRPPSRRRRRAIDRTRSSRRWTRTPSTSMRPARSQRPWHRLARSASSAVSPTIAACSPSPPPSSSRRETWFAEAAPERRRTGLDRDPLLQPARVHPACLESVLRWTRPPLRAAAGRQRLDGRHAGYLEEIRAAAGAGSGRGDPQHDQPGLPRRLQPGASSEREDATWCCSTTTPS